MCLGIPVQVIRVEGSFAQCRDRSGAMTRVDLLLVGVQPVGTWLMNFMGAARSVIDADEAARIGGALDALRALLEGRKPDLDAAFADLAGREPQLPVFLRPRLPAADAAGSDKRSTSRLVLHDHADNHVDRHPEQQLSNHHGPHPQESQGDRK